MAFKEAFGCGPLLRLQDLTADDIRHYIEDKLAGNKHMMVLMEREPTRAAKLIQSVIDKAEGVFLWVTLVIKSLLEGLTNRDDISTLERRLAMLPQELEDLYGHMLSLISPIYMEESSRIFQVYHVSQANGWADMQIIHDALSIDHRHQPMTIASNPAFYTQHMPRLDLHSLSKSMEIMLQSRCGGLIEIILHPSPTWGELSYTLRTMNDYMERPTVWENLVLRKANSSFDPHLVLIVSCLSNLKHCSFRECKG